MTAVLDVIAHVFQVVLILVKETVLLLVPTFVETIRVLIPVLLLVAPLVLVLVM